MPYRRDIAAQLLIDVAAALRRDWDKLSPGSQQALARLVDDGGHDLYRQNAANRATACVRLLDKIALLPDLPQAVKAVLAGGAGISTVISVTVTDGQRDRVLVALCQLYDPRRYSNPWVLAEELHQRIGQAKGQLDAGTRQRWEQLDGPYPGVDPVKYLDELGRLLGDKLAFVAQAMEAGKTWEPQHLSAAIRPPVAISKGVFEPERDAAESTGGASRDAPRTGGEATEERVSPATPQTTPADPVRVSRSANVYFPSILQLAQKRVPLIVHVARAPSEGTVTITQGSGSVNLLVGDLIISVITFDFDVEFAIGGAELPGVNTMRSVKVDPNGDSEPLVFFLSPVDGCEAGKKRISVEFIQNHKRQGSLGFEVDLVSGPLPAVGIGNAVKPDFRVAAAALAPGQSMNKPDLNLRVCLQGTVLKFSLVSSNGSYCDTPLGETDLTTDPPTYFDRIARELSTLAALPVGDEDRRTPDEQEQAEFDLQTTGVRLWDRLIPERLKEVYANDLRVNWAGKSLVITSDEPWIPWEMVRPVGRDGGRVLFIDPPLCEQFRLTRWLNGPAAPEQLEVKRGVLVAPKDNLQFVQEEVDYFATFGWAAQVQTLKQVTEEFKNGSAQVFHFSCHGRAGDQGGDEPMLKLGDEFLKPSYVLGQPLKLYECMPLVFLNACEAGQPNFELTGLGGWASAFIQLQASIFIGSLWAINDKLAADFAESFYNRLFGVNGQPQQSVGDAFHAARQDIKKQAPGNPTWLAYVLYGDPNGRVYVGN